MDHDETKNVFGAQKERVKLAIQELSELRDTLDGGRRDSVEAVLNRLREALDDDDKTFYRL